METKLDLQESTIESLQDLIRINIDSAKGFRDAAEELDDDTLANKMRSIADERESQAEQLQQYVSFNGEEPRKEGSYAAAVHRCWMNTRELFTSNDKYAILAEAERGEDQIKAAYEKTLKDEPANAMNDVLIEQYDRVKSQHDLIRDLRDECKESSS